MSKLIRNITLEVERSVIGSMLKVGLTPTARAVLDRLQPEMFLFGELGHIFGAMKKQAYQQGLIDMVMLNSDYQLDFALMAEIAKDTASTANLDGYAEKVTQFYQRREAQNIFTSVATELNHSRDDQLDAITEKGLQHLSKLLAKGGKLQPIAMQPLLDSYMTLFEERAQPNFKDRLLFTGVQAIDDKLAGIGETDVCIVAGRAGNGKTETAITFTQNILNNGGSVLFFSLEMSREQIMDRLVVSASGVNSSCLRNPEKMSDTDFTLMGEALNRMRDHRLFIVDKGGLTVDEIIAVAEAHIQEQGKVSAIIVDYIGLVRHGALDGRINRSYQIEQSVERLKTFSKDSHTPVILLSQLGRDAEGKRPKNSDLSDSKALEQVASQIIMVHNERDKDTNEPAKYTEFIITKNRFGSLGTVYMEFKNGRFIECDQALAWEACQKAPEKSKRNKKVEF